MRCWKFFLFDIAYFLSQLSVEGPLAVKVVVAAKWHMTRCWLKIVHYAGMILFIYFLLLGFQIMVSAFSGAFNMRRLFQGGLGKNCSGVFIKSPWLLYHVFFFEKIPFKEIQLGVYGFNFFFVVLVIRYLKLFVSPLDGTSHIQLSVTFLDTGVYLPQKKLK